MSQYLVTGGAGFIGSHLIEALIEQGHTVRVLDDLSTGKRENLPANVELVVGSIVDADLVKKCMQDVEGVFHLAAVSSVQKSNEDWQGTHQINLTGTINILDAARPNQVPVVYASSAAVYGDNAAMPLQENSTTRPLTAYGADKLGSELHARVASLVHQVPTVGMRFFNVYGPRQDPASPYSGVISIFADRILRNEDVKTFGDGEQTRDFVYVKDVVEFLLAAVEKASHHPMVFNVCTGKSTSINQLASTLMSITGNRVEITRDNPRAGDIRVSLGDPSRARYYLGVSASVSLGTGLRSLVDFVIGEQEQAA